MGAFILNEVKHFVKGVGGTVVAGFLTRNRMELLPDGRKIFAVVLVADGVGEEDSEWGGSQPGFHVLKVQKSRAECLKVDYDVTG